MFKTKINYNVCEFMFYETYLPYFILFPVGELALK